MERESRGQGMIHSFFFLFVLLFTFIRSLLMNHLSNTYSLSGIVQIAEDTVTDMVVNIAQCKGRRGLRAMEVERKV